MSEATPKDILISFDTTGSMYPCLAQVRKNVAAMVTRLFKEVSGVRIGIIAHGDYCDEKSTYITTTLDFTTDESKLVHFINNVKSTGGGDWAECYEFVLNHARTLSWSAGTSKSFIMIGDAIPHEPSYPLNTRKLDWKNESSLLAEAGVKIYSVQAMNTREATPFWKKIAETTKGYHLKLDQFTDLYHLIMAVGLQQMGDDVLASYEKELIVNGQFNRNMDNIIGTMLGRVASTTFTKTSEELGAVPPGRFQIMTVDSDIAIKTFVENNGITFKQGRGFYQFTKRVEVQDYKEIILQHKLTGDMFTGAKARELAGIPVGVSAKVSPEHMDDYIAFIQSTSNNRKLLAGTKFLYEVPEEVK